MPEKSNQSLGDIESDAGGLKVTLCYLNTKRKK